MSEEPAPERPSRYDRTFGGLVAAMVVTVVFVAGYVGFRAITREQPQIQPEVDYLACVSLLQAGDVSVAYPRLLPSGWIATSATFERGTPPQWRLGILTDRQEFVGIAQQQQEVEELVDTYVDGDADQGDDSSPENSLGVDDWQTWSDSGGDHAFSTTLDSGGLSGETVLVYGSAPVADLEAVVSLLTLDQAPAPTTTTGCDNIS